MKQRLIYLSANIMEIYSDTVPAAVLMQKMRRI